MRSQSVMAALAATASASTNLFPGHQAVRRDLVVARQTDSTDAPTATSGGLSDSECQASLLAIATELPIPGGDLLDWEQSQAGTDPCSVTSVPSSLSSQYTSYTDAVMSWYSESSSELYAALSACPQYAGAVSEVQVCTEVTMVSGTVSGTVSSTVSGTSSTSVTTSTRSDNEPSATGSSTGTASGSASSPVETTNGAPLRGAGVVGAVLAGFLGVAVAL